MNNIISLVDYLHRGKSMSEAGEPMDLVKFIIGAAYSKSFKIDKIDTCPKHSSQEMTDFRSTGEKECETCFVGYFHHT